MNSHINKQLQNKRVHVQHVIGCIRPYRINKMKEWSCTIRHTKQKKLCTHDPNEQQSRHLSGAAKSGMRSWCDSFWAGHALMLMTARSLSSRPADEHRSALTSVWFKEHHSAAGNRILGDFQPYTEQPGDLERSSRFHVETWASPGPPSALTVVDRFAFTGGVDLSKLLFWNTPAGEAEVAGSVSLLGLQHSCLLLGTCLNSLWSQMGHVSLLWQFQTTGTSLWETATVAPFFGAVIFIMNCLNHIMF